MRGNVQRNGRTPLSLDAKFLWQNAKIFVTMATGVSRGRQVCMIPLNWLILNTPSFGTRIWDLSPTQTEL